jgi:hypothetical protein
MEVICPHFWIISTEERNYELYCHLIEVKRSPQLFQFVIFCYGGSCCGNEWRSHVLAFVSSTVPLVFYEWTFCVLVVILLTAAQNIFLFAPKPMLSCPVSHDYFHCFALILFCFLALNFRNVCCKPCIRQDHITDRQCVCLPLWICKCPCYWIVVSLMFCIRTCLSRNNTAHSLTSTSVNDLLLVTVSVNNEVVAYHCFVTAFPFHILVRKYPSFEATAWYQRGRFLFGSSLFCL